MSAAVAINRQAIDTQPSVSLRRDFSAKDALVALLIFLFWLVYENVLFFYPLEYGGAALFALTNAIKLLLPFGLLLYTGLPSHRMLFRGYTSLYIVLFAAFLAWGLVPTLFFGGPVEWVKLLPRFTFFLAVVAFFSKQPVAFSLFAKCMVLYVLSALLQYILLYVTGAYDSPIDYGFALLAGPFGWLGNITSIIYLPAAPLPFIRLTGFWNEPSNASGCAFAAAFLARYLVMSGESRRWGWASVACFISGVLALSNAGYFALGSALLVGMVFGIKRLTSWRLVQLALLAPAVLAVFLVVAFGRTYVANNMPDNIWARALTGVHDADEAIKDPTSGRLELANSAIESSASTFVGVGIQVAGSGGFDAPAGAPLYWLYLTGIPGLLLLLGREGVLLMAARSLTRDRPIALPVVQALIAVMAQHTSYGSWMNPNYFILAAMVLVSARDARQGR